MIEFDDNDERRFALTPFARRFAWFMRLIAFPPVELYFKVIHRARAIGLENIPKEGGALLCANHQAWADTMLIPVTCLERWKTRPFLSPAKEELFKVPLLGTMIRLWGAFPVKRRQRDLEAMKRIAYYARNYPVMLFPEGTRSKTGKLLRGRAGVGWIAYSARTTVIPTLVINTELYPTSRRGNRWFGVPYTVVYGEPLDLTSYYDRPESKETSQAISDEIMRAIATLREKYKDLSVNPPLLGDPSAPVADEA
jgi:1-acyl-sn-glycerol-3-phosphate acyltransferase